MAQKAAAIEKWRKGVESVSMGVHPSQIAQAKENFRRETGRNIDFTPDGNPVFYSAAAQEDCARALGMRNRKGYGGRGKPTWIGTLETDKRGKRKVVWRKA